MTGTLHNPRVIGANLALTAEVEMLAAGVTAYGVRVMAPKARHFTIMLENVSRLHANLIKQHMLSLGGEAAVHKHIPTEQVETTRLLLTGTVTNLEGLRQKLQAQAFALPATGELIHQTVANYGRNRWTLQCRGQTLEVGRQPIIMGIVNVTPDSFSDGGQFFDAGQAAARGLLLATQGAHVLDIGGESTRPGAAEVSVEEEIRRVVPVIEGLKKQTGLVLSIDTRRAAVARAALDAGVGLVNDISALGDPQMGPLVARSGAAVVLMHMQGTPATMQAAPHYEDVVADVCRELRRALARALDWGIDLEQTVIDPGIGFGKTPEHNLTLLRRLAELRSLGRPILVGTSRKAFLGKILGTEAGERLPGTLATQVWTRSQGAAIFRVHDVAEVASALQVAAAIEQTQEDRR